MSATDAIVTCGKVAFCASAGFFAQANAPEIPALPPAIEKGGVWGIVFLLMWWILGKHSRQIDRLTEVIEALPDKLAERLNAKH